MIGVLDIGIGNLGSVKNALYNLGMDSVPVSTPADFLEITHLLLPGVGSFASAMDKLNSTKLVDPIHCFAKNGKPILGICLGMQLLATRGIEGGACSGLDLVPGQINPITPTKALRIPHMGWNEVVQKKTHPLLRGIRDNADFYFVHSYRFQVLHDDVIAVTEHGEIFPSIVGLNNVIGVQFHPEKSQSNGMKLLENFCSWDGAC